MAGKDGSLTGFGAFKLHVANQLTSSVINILATYFEFQPALYEKVQGNGLEFVEKLVERGVIKENDISILLDALEKSKLGGKKSNIHNAFERYRKDATREFPLKSVMSGSSSLETKKDFFHCTICTKFFVEPKLLPCFHRYCKRCLENLIQEDTVACSLCSNQCPVPAEGVQGFKTDYHMENMIQFKCIKSSFVSETRQDCFGCPSKSIIAWAFCFKCNNFICNVCYKFHLTNNMMADHRDKVKKAKYFQQEQFDFQNYLSLKEPPKCHIHKNTVAQKLCYTCNNRPLCITCYSKEHNEHTLYEINAPDTTDGKEIMAVKEELKKCENKYESIVGDIEIAEKNISATSTFAVQRLDKEHGAKSRAMQIKVQELTTNLSETKIKLEKNLHDKTRSLKLIMEEKIQRLTRVYQSNVQALESKVKTTKETLERNHKRAVQTISEKRIKLTAKLKEEKLALNKQNSDRCEEVLKIRLSAKHLCRRQQNLCATIQSIDDTNDWTLSLVDIMDASKQLLEDVKNTFLNLQSLLKHCDLVSDEIAKKNGSDCNVPMFHRFSVVEIKDMKSTTQRIHSIASCGQNRIVITGYDSRGHTFISVVDGSGKQLQLIKCKEQNVIPARLCASHSMSGVATVSKTGTFGIFDATGKSFHWKDISNIIPTLTSKWHITCVASDPSNKKIYVGARNLSIYVFNQQLEHLRTVDLSKTLKSLTGVVVLGRELLVCDKARKRAYIVTNQNQSKLQQEIDKSGFGADEYCPMDVCTDNDGFIFILWAPTIPGNGSRIAVKYSQDGRKLLSQQKLENRVNCITIMKTCHDKDILVAASGKSCKMSLFAIADPCENDGPPSCSSQEKHQSLNILIAKEIDDKDIPKPTNSFNKPGKPSKEKGERNSSDIKKKHLPIKVNKTTSIDLNSDQARIQAPAQKCHPIVVDPLAAPVASGTVHVNSNKDNNKSRRQDSGSTTKPTQGVINKHLKRHLDNNDNGGSKKRKVVSDSQSVHHRNAQDRTSKGLKHISDAKQAFTERQKVPQQQRRSPSKVAFHNKSNVLHQKQRSPTKATYR